MTQLLRLLGAVVTAMVLWCGLVQPAEAAILPGNVPAVPYNAVTQPVHLVDTAAERGPPSTNHAISNTPVDGGSPRGAPTRPSATATRESYDWEGTALLEQNAGATTTTGGHGVVAEADFSSLQRSSVAANAGSGALRSVDEVLGGLPKGKQSWVRMVSDESSLTTKFNELTEGGTPTTWKNFNGTVIERGDGVQVGMRSSSSSGGGAIDIRMPDGSRIRIHVEQP